MRMKGIILAAGKGTRLYPVTRHIAKPLLPLANRMTLEYAFDRLKEIDVTDICVVVGQMEQEMRQALGSGSQFGVDLTFVRQTDPHGLAHALGFANEFAGVENFALYLGDAVYGGGFEAHARRFMQSGCANLNIVKQVPDPSRFGVANVEGERIVRLVEKPKTPESNLAMAGMYFFTSAIWPVLLDLQPSARGEYEITDAIQMLIDRGETVLAGELDGDWFDTGTLDSFLETSRFLSKGETLIAGNVGQSEVRGAVVVGEQASVECESLEDCVILPNAEVRVGGSIRHALIGGQVESQRDIESQVVFGGDRQ